MLLFRSGGARFTTFIQSLKAYHGLNPHDDPEETGGAPGLADDVVVSQFSVLKRTPEMPRKRLFMEDWEAEK